MLRFLKISIAVVLIHTDLYGQNWTPPPFYETSMRVDSCNFDDNHFPIIIEPGNIGSTWSIGSAADKFPPSMPLKGNSIFTDSQLYYQPGTDAIFMFAGPLNLQNLALNFNHNYDTDTLHDGGFVEISFDSGKTWINVVDDSMQYLSACYECNENFYTRKHKLHDGNKGFSGSSHGWIRSWFFDIQLVGIFNNLYPMLRFHFVSDSISEMKAGWAIDDIRIYDYPTMGGLNALQWNAVEAFPNPAQQEFNLKLKFPSRSWSVELYGIDGKLLTTVEGLVGIDANIPCDPAWQGICYYKIKTIEGYLAGGKLAFE